MTEFCKPRGEIDYPELAVEAATKVRWNAASSRALPANDASCLVVLIGRWSQLR